MPDFDPRQYAAAMQRLSMLAGLLDDEPITEMIEYADRIHAVGPFVDPTAYHRGSQNIDDQLRLLRVLKKVQGVVRELKAEAGARHA